MQKIVCVKIGCTLETFLSYITCIILYTNTELVIVSFWGF